jgi:hypothetical protein
VIGKPYVRTLHHVINGVIMILNFIRLYIHIYAHAIQVLQATITIIIQTIQRIVHVPPVVVVALVVAAVEEDLEA